MQGAGEAELDGDAVRGGQAVAVGGCRTDEGRALLPEPGVRGGHVPGADQPADVHFPRQVREQVVHPRAGGDDGDVEVLTALVGADLDTVRDGHDLADRGVAVDAGAELFGAVSGGLDRQLGPDEARPAVEYGRVAVLDPELREALGERLGVQNLVVQAVLGDGLEDRGHLLVLRRPHQQASGQPAQFAAGVLLELLPQGVGVLEQRDVPGVLEVRAAEDPGLAAGGAAVVARGEAVIPDDLGSACGQSPGGLAAHRSDAYDGDALLGRHKGFLSSPGAWMLNARLRTLGFRMDRGAGSMTTSALSGEGDFVIALCYSCHIVERCARIWHENGSRS